MFLCRLCARQEGERFICAKCGAPCRTPSAVELAAALDRQTQTYRRSASRQLSAPPKPPPSQPPGFEDVPIADQAVRQAGQAVAQAGAAAQQPGPAGMPAKLAKAGSRAAFLNPELFAPQVAAAPAEPEPPPVEAQEEPPKAPIPFSERKPPFFCKNHEAVKATCLCERCKEFYCSNCRKMVEDNPICEECGAQLKLLSREEQGLPPLPFSQRVEEAFAYPFRGAGKVMLPIGAVFCWLLSYAGFYGIGLSMAFMYTYFAKVCRTAASGRESPPDWPEGTDFGNSLYFLVAKVATLAPVLLYVYFAVGYSSFMVPSRDDEEAVPDTEPSKEQLEWKKLADNPRAPPAVRRAARERFESQRRPEFRVNWTAIIGHLAVAGFLYLAGSFCLPMALLALLLHRSYAALNPAFVISSIFRVGGEYLLTYLVLVLTDVVYVLVRIYGDNLFIVGRLAGLSIWLYFMMLYMYETGRIYYLNQKRLAWFQVNED